MKRKLSWENEEESSEIEDEESEEEPIIQSVLDSISSGVSHHDAKDLLHSMAASKNIVYWTSAGELVRNQQRIPQSSITDLLDYVLLPYNNDVPRPKALYSFLLGLAKLGINKRLIRNKKVLSDLIVIEDELSSEETSDDDDDDDSGSKENENDTGNESDSDQSSQEDDEDDTPAESCAYCENNDIKVHRLLECPHCMWSDGINETMSSAQCPICKHDIPVDKNTEKAVITRCHACNTIHHRAQNKDKLFRIDEK